MDNEVKKTIAITIIALLISGCAFLQKPTDAQDDICLTMCAIHTAVDVTECGTDARYWTVLDAAQDVTSCFLLCEDSYEAVYSEFEYQCLSDAYDGMVLEPDSCPDLSECV